MKNVLRAEEAVLFLFSILLFQQLDYSWWWFAALLLVPDIGMLGYLSGPRTGAFTYNLFHHKGLALALLMTGYWFQQDIMQLAGIILFAHSSMDRAFGYGLKYASGFQDTHLGILGPGKPVKK